LERGDKEIHFIVRNFNGINRRKEEEHLKLPSKGRGKYLTIIRETEEKLQWKEKSRELKREIRRKM
jgi:hypothetical protein